MSIGLMHQHQHQHQPANTEILHGILRQSVVFISVFSQIPVCTGRARKLLFPSDPVKALTPPLHSMTLIPHGTNILSTGGHLPIPCDLGC